MSWHWERPKGHHFDIACLRCDSCGRLGTSWVSDPHTAEGRDAERDDCIAQDGVLPSRHLCSVCGWATKNNFDRRLGVDDVYVENDFYNNVSRDHPDTVGAMRRLGMNVVIVGPGWGLGAAYSPSVVATFRDLMLTVVAAWWARRTQQTTWDDDVAKQLGLPLQRVLESMGVFDDGRGVGPVVRPATTVERLLCAPQPEKSVSVLIEEADDAFTE